MNSILGSKRRRVSERRRITHPFYIYPKTRHDLNLSKVKHGQVNKLVEINENERKKRKISSIITNANLTDKEREIIEKYNQSISSLVTENNLTEGERKAIARYI